MDTALLDNMEKIKALDKSAMLSFCVNSEKHYKEALKLAEQIPVCYAKPKNIIIAGMGGSGIGGDLLKDWARNQLTIPIEVNREYHLPAYANNETFIFVISYSGDTEESLGAFLDALKRQCMIYCISSGGALLEYAEKLKLPYLRVPAGMPPRAALPYLLVPLLICMEKMGLVSGASEELLETLTILKEISKDNIPEKPAKENFTKTLASNIGESIPVVYGFGTYRSVAQRFKQQFNENSKVPSKWEVFSELNHNEIVGWENIRTTEGFTAIFLRDRNEPIETRSRIEATQQFMHQEGLKLFEIYSQGISPLAKMLSSVIIGDFVSIYLAVLLGEDPTPVGSINQLKETLKKSGVKNKIIDELARFKL
jgi:glucose/mannose-6-phosphate isomerase